MRRLFMVLALGLAGAAHAAWEQNHCVQCHQREVLPITLGHSFADWHASIHAKGGVGCEKCHGGDPEAKDPATAHANIRPAADADSMVHPTRLPVTCGTCHPNERSAFEGTVHARQLAAKKEGATCFTCHEAMATSLPTPRELTARCAVCHEKPVEAQAALAVLVMAKKQLYRTRTAMDAAQTASPAWYAGARDRFHDLERDYAAVQLRWHTFETREVLQDSRDLLKLAEALADEAEVKARRGEAK
jgi:hypothetical protein